MRLYDRTDADCAYYIRRHGFIGAAWFSDSTSAWSSCGQEHIEINLPTSLLDTAWRDGASIAGERNWTTLGEIATAHIVQSA